MCWQLRYPRLNTVNSSDFAAPTAATLDSDPMDDRKRPDSVESGESPAPAPQSRALGLPLGEGERVLLVDDEENVRRVATKLLEKLGYVVRAAQDGEEALAILEGGERFDLVLTDVIMPRLTGIEMAERIRAFLPEQKVLFTSGYTARHYGQAPGEPPEPFMPKPFSMADLAQNVRSTLDG